MLILHKMRKVLKEERKWLGGAKKQIKLFKMQRMFDAISEVTKILKFKRVLVHPRLKKNVFTALRLIPVEEKRKSDDFCRKWTFIKSVKALKRNTKVQ